MADAARAQTLPVRVFISYAWESVEYRRLVKGLATRLRYDGIDARLDAWHLRDSTTIPEFMNREVRHASKVLVICSPQYRSKIHAMEDGRISGVGWEALLVSAAIYAGLVTRDQVVSVLLRGTWQESAPLFLAGGRYTDLSNPSRFEGNYLELLRRLTGHEERAPELGHMSADIDPEPVDPMQGIPGCNSWPRTNADDEDVDRRFSFEDLHGNIKKATEEQYVVLDYLRNAKRAVIGGSAGSGKTWVAAEKAIRLSIAGDKVLFLCHNPQLASYVKSELTKRAPVHVYDFGSWVRGVPGPWNLFDEPDDADLAAALERLSAADHQYDAIIVDEAQDFRDDWWAVVEAGLRPDGCFYIFHDDNQSLLPHRGSYPRIGTELDLSRNCRNAQRVFELMRCFAPALPEARLDGGSVLLSTYQPGKEREESAKIIREVFRLFRYDGIGRTVVLWAGSEKLDETPLANYEIVVSDPLAWKEEVIRQFERVLRRRDAPGLTLPQGGAKWVKEELGKLSSAPYPTAGDVDRVQRVANSFKVSHAVRAKIERSRTRMRRPLHWVGSGSALAFGRGAEGLTWGAELVLYFGRDNWHEGIPEPTVLRITPNYTAEDRISIPLYSVAEFKGLERDIVILCLRGRTLAQNAVIYVGVSRARSKLIILADELAVRDLPTAFHWDHSLTRH